MTKQEWLQDKNPEPMLKFLRGKVSDRKLRLFSCSCCRHIWNLLYDDVSRLTVEIVERYADGIVTDDELQTRHSMTGDSESADTASEAAAPEAWDSARSVAMYAAHNAAHDADPDHAEMASRFDQPYTGLAQNAFVKEKQAQIALIRDIFGSPFRPVTVDPRWLTPTAVGIAQAIYDDRAFDRLPILADALQDAGCEDADVLAHCRGDGPHVRGCWVVDLVLGKQ